MGTLYECTDENFNAWVRKERAKYLNCAEDIFGPMRSGWKPSDKVGIRECNPNVFLLKGTKEVAIQLTRNALEDWQNGCHWRARGQLAHECIHLLDPNFPPPTNVLEEGLATWFETKIEPKFRSDKQSYIHALALISDLMKDGYLQEEIKNLRAVGTRIRDIVWEDLVSDRIDHETAKALTRDFERT